MNRVSISDFIDKIGDGIHGTPAYSENGTYYFINGNNLKNGHIVVGPDTLMIEDDEYEKIKRPLDDNTILISINGTIGNTAFYRGEKIALGKSACYLNVKYSENKYYLRYVLSTKEFLKYALQVAHGSTIKNLAPSQIAEYSFFAPDAISRDKISSLLKMLDDKIDLNNRICFELENMAKTLYDYWFLQFDFPNADGRPYRTSGGEMVWNEQLKREIPKGWTVGKIGRLGSIVSGGTPTTTCVDYYCDNGFAWITPNDLSDNDEKMFVSHGERDITQAGIDNSSAVLMPKHSVLLSTRAPIGYLAISNNEVCTNQGFKSIIPNAGYQEYYIYYLLKRNIPAISRQGAGTTFQEVSKETLSDFRLLLPPKPIANAFASTVSSLCENRCILEKENRELTKLRDWLLPMLMNGQARIVGG